MVPPKPRGTTEDVPLTSAGPKLTEAGSRIAGPCYAGLLRSCSSSLQGVGSCRVFPPIIRLREGGRARPA
eukprot:5114559-Alexandrium_andersonii.AAC.1